MAPTWDANRTQSGYHWDLMEMQGRDNVIFIGGSLVVDNVMAVMELNRLILKHLEPTNDCKDEL